MNYMLFFQYYRYIFTLNWQVYGIREYKSRLTFLRATVNPKTPFNSDVMIKYYIDGNPANLIKTRVSFIPNRIDQNPMRGNTNASNKLWYRGYIFSFDQRAWHAGIRFSGSVYSTHNIICDTRILCTSYTHIRAMRICRPQWNA